MHCTADISEADELKVECAGKKASPTPTHIKDWPGYRRSGLGVGGNYKG